MKRMLPASLLAAASLGHMAGYAAKPRSDPGPRSGAVASAHFDDVSFLPGAYAQETMPETRTLRLSTE